MRFLAHSHVLKLTATLMSVMGVTLPSHATIPSSRPLGRSAHATCAPVWFIGARGSGEKALKSQYGLGIEVYKMEQAARDFLGHAGVRLSVLADVYQAASVKVLVPSTSEAENFLTSPGAIPYYIDHNADPYLASITAGITDAENALRTVLTLCPNAQIIMAGYSQGAIAMHDAEVSLAQNSPSEFSHIAATLLLGDGDRVPSTRAHLFGSASSSASGIRVALHLVRPVDVPSPSSTAEIADRGDIVADFSFLGDWTVGAKVHTGYQKNQRDQNMLAAAARWAAGLALSRVRSAGLVLGSPTIAGAQDVPMGVTLSGNTFTDAGSTTNRSSAGPVPFFWQSAEYWRLVVSSTTPVTFQYNINTGTGGPIVQFMDQGTSDQNVGGANGLDFSGSPSGFNIGVPGTYQFSLQPGEYVVALGVGNAHGTDGSYDMTFSTATSPNYLASSSSGSATLASAQGVVSGMTVEGNEFTDPAAIASQVSQSVPSGWTSAEYWSVQVGAGQTLAVGFSNCKLVGGPSLGIVSASGVVTGGGGQASPGTLLDTNGSPDGNYVSNQGWYVFTLPAGQYYLVVGSSPSSGSDGEFAVTVNLVG